MKLLLILFTALSIAAKTDSYTNPVLFSDYSDPDVIRVGNDYWMTASSFTCFPGLQILHSTDLVNWEIVNAALPSMERGGEMDSPSHGNGVWAPCIRYHDGQYWIFWGDPDRGAYQIHASDPRGKWSEPHLIMAGKGIIDTSPLWDDDGKVYLVHSWAGSRFGFKSYLCVCEMSADCTEVIGEQVLVFDGKKSDDDTVEGPKFYKRNGWYYIFAPSGGVKEGWQLVLKSRNVYGPYEARTVLHQGPTDIHGPHQGGWVTDIAGDSWFLHFEDRYAWGRVCHLQPMTWSEDGWCVIGVDTDGDGIGEPVSSYRYPSVAPGVEKVSGLSALATSTGFTGTSIPLNWQWEANPQFFWAMPNPSLGCLRLNCIKSPEGWRNLRDTPNVLAQKVVGPKMEFTAKFVYRPSYAGERVGLVMTGRSYSSIELNYDGSALSLVRRDCIGAERGVPESIIASQDYTLGSDGFATVWLRVGVKDNVICSFSYSTDGKKFRALGSDFKGVEGHWVGAKIGLFAIGEIQKNDGGSVEIY